MAVGVVVAVEEAVLVAVWVAVEVGVLVAVGVGVKSTMVAEAGALSERLTVVSITLLRILPVRVSK